ncbi:hypothetical protein DLJ48_01715 [Oenococcus sicerae]|uniref:Uncharacterized protein n=1 Tax=Oenococcus sicerae TaxID=2203724 RepID=A0ABX5QKR2_9LACO|nr:hypothetical protein [Oenococcus sicerae]QAS69328.1 hypothetical protein DLJ48_01715 [Oenococcus sicerae]
MQDGNNKRNGLIFSFLFLVTLVFTLLFPDFRNFRFSISYLIIGAFVVLSIISFANEKFKKLIKWFNDRLLVIEVFVISSFLILELVLIVALGMDIKGSKNYGSLITGVGIMLSTFIALFLDESTRRNQMIDQRLKSLPRWVMPAAYETIRLLPTNGPETFVDSVRYYYVVLKKDVTVAKGMVEEKDIVRHFPCCDKDRNFFGDNAIALVETKPYIMNALQAYRLVNPHSLEEGNEVIIVSANSALGDKSFMINGDGVNGHFYLKSHHLVAYSLTPEATDNEELRRQQEKWAENYCQLFGLL